MDSKLSVETQIEVLETLAEQTHYNSPFITLGEYMEAIPNGFSIRDSEDNLESFTEDSIGLYAEWEIEPTGDRYSKACVYPFYCMEDTTRDILHIVDTYETFQWCTGIDKVFEYYTSYEYSVGIEPFEVVKILDSLMCNINAILLPLAKRYAYYTYGPDCPVEAVFPIDEIRKEYLVYCEELLSPVTNPWFCNTGDAPVIFDAPSQWDSLHESAGGWNRIQPQDEPDFRLRNDLEFNTKEEDFELTESERGWEFTRYIMRERDSRILRYEGLIEILNNARTMHKLCSSMLHIELSYKRSLYQCEKLGSFNNHSLVGVYITRKQLDSIRVTYRNLLKGFKPNPSNLRPNYLAYAVALHQCDKTTASMKASRRIMHCFKGIKKDLVGEKYYEKLVDIKNRMFRHICRNVKKIVK